MPACEIGYLQPDGTPIYFEGFRDNGMSAKYHSDRRYAYVFSTAGSALKAALQFMADRNFFIFALNDKGGNTPVFRAVPKDPNMTDAQKWHVMKITGLGREFLSYRNNGWCWSTEQADSQQFDGYKEAQLIIDTHIKEKTGVAVVRFTYVPVKERLEVLRSHYDDLTIRIDTEARDGHSDSELLKEQQDVWAQIITLAQKGDVQS